MLTFNRTIMELKFVRKNDCGRRDWTFNRTIMELKYASIIRSKDTNELLIVPLWN